MTIAPSLLRGLKVPVIAAPMLLVSNPALLIATCRAGAIGTLPAMNERTTAGLERWIEQIEAALGPEDAIYGVNLIVAKPNTRLRADLDVLVRHKVPLVITSFGADLSVVQEVHAYGGLVFHDVATARHIEVAAAAGVDGLILLSHGAGGHTGRLSPFAILHEAKRRFDGMLLLAGALSTGADVAAAQVAGADFAYMGTRFIATREANADPEYKQQIVHGGAGDVVVTRAISGNPASFLSESLRSRSLDPQTIARVDQMLSEDPLGRPIKAWKEIWSAGEGIAGIDDIPDCASLVARLTAEYRAALQVRALA